MSVGHIYEQDLYTYIPGSYAVSLIAPLFELSSLMEE